mmetsp:Transcript_19394/g.43341  ORF Transcript_19394/g.43341 Transcript_19394/m.43341 type:complete len:295 (-) Transcript_19394:139-1023(-)
MPSDRSRIKRARSAGKVKSTPMSAEMSVLTAMIKMAPSRPCTLVWPEPSWKKRNPMRSAKMMVCAARARVSIGLRTWTRTLREISVPNWAKNWLRLERRSCWTGLFRDVIVGGLRSRAATISSMRRLASRSSGPSEESSLSAWSVGLSNLRHGNPRSLKWSVISSGLPAKTILPRASTMTWSNSLMMSTDGWWIVLSTVMPRFSASPLTWRMILCAVLESSPEVGSSSIRSEASEIIEVPMLTRLRSPPLSPRSRPGIPMIVSRRSQSPRSWRSSSTAASRDSAVHCGSRSLAA